MKKVIIIFLAALLLRCLLINWTLQFGNNGDFTRYEDWARIAHVYNFADTYTTTHLSFDISYPNNQPPGSLYILSGFYELWILAGRVILRITHAPAGSLLWVNTYLQHIFMKIPALLTDLLMGLLAYLLVAKEKGIKRGMFAASLILFNPVIFYNSAIWGQMDSINNFFFLLSLFFAFRKHITLSVIACAISLYIKLSLLPLVPFYLVFLYFTTGKNVIKMLIEVYVAAAILFIATFPISLNPFQWFAKELPIIARGEIQSMTVAAFNFWFALMCRPTVCNISDVTEKILGITLSLWAYAIFSIFSIPLLVLQIKKHKAFLSMQNVFLLLSVIALLVFLFLPNMHDRYMYPVFPLFAIAIALRKNFKVYFFFYCLLSLFHLDNIAYSWYPVVLQSTTVFYHIFYGPVLRWIISILTVLVGVGLYIKSFLEFSWLSRE